MSEVAIQRFACDGCGKKYPWKPELSHKRALCKCGTKITVPDLSQQSDEPPPLPDDGILDFVESAPEIASTRVAALRSAAMPAVATAAAVAPKARAAPVLGYRQGPTRRETKRASEQFSTMHDMTRDVYVPTGLIVGAFLAYFAWLMFHGTATSGASLGFYGAIMVVIFAAKTVCMIAGAFVVASLASVSFGPFWTAILKLAAVAIAPDIFATIVEEAIGSPGAGLLAGSLALGFYWFLISYLFSMDANEAWIVVVLFGVLRWVLTFVVGMMLIGMLMSGNVPNIGGGGAGAVPSATQEAAELNEKVADWEENNRLVEGLEYIDKSGRQSEQLETIKALYAGGAKKVWFAVDRDINGKTEPFTLVGEWPRDAKKREALVAAIKKVQADRAAKFKAANPDWGPLDQDPIADNGGKYFEFPIGQ